MINQFDNPFNIQTIPGSMVPRLLPIPNRNFTPTFPVWYPYSHDILDSYCKCEIGSLAFGTDTQNNGLIQ